MLACRALGRIRRALREERGSILFDGLNDVVTGPALTQGDLVTYFAWIYPNSQGENNNGKIIQHGTDGGGGRRASFDITTTWKLRFASDRATTGGLWTTPQDSLVASRWQSVAMTYDYGSTANDPVMYVDAVAQSLTEVLTPAGAAAADGGTFYVGNSVAGDRTFDGRIAAVAAWNRLLTAEEILYVHLRGARQLTNGQLLRWAMSGSDVNARDYSGNGRNGTPSGGATLAEDPPVVEAVDAVVFVG